MTRARLLNQRGFIVAPLLFVLGIAGVSAMVITQGGLQLLGVNNSVQKNLALQSDLNATVITLSAQSVLGTDAATVCPPRSSSASSVCGYAPVALTTLASYVGTTLPTNAANASAGGSPYEVGVLTANSGAKVLDPYGHNYIICRWENVRSMPASNALMIISAGPSGNLQTNCGATTAAADNVITTVSVATLINRAAVWQTDASSNASYGATGTKVVIDPSGDITAAGSITVGGGIIANGNITAANITASSAFYGGGASVTTLAATGAVTANNYAVALTSAPPTVGMYSAGTNRLDFSTNGVQAINIDGAQQVTVNGGLSARKVQVQSSDVPSNGMNNPSTNQVALWANSTQMLTAWAGNGVGIGSNNPTAALDVVGSIKTTANLTAGGLGTFQTISVGTATLGATTVSSLTNVGSENVTGTVTANAGTFQTLTVNGQPVTGGGGCSTNCTFTGATTVSSLTNTGSENVTGTVTAGNFNTTGTYQVSGAQIAASNLSNGTTGTGSIVLSVSPTLTGTPKAPTQTAGDTSAAIATDSFVATAITNAATITAISLGTNGYVSFSGGLTFQWGLAAACGAQNCGVTFPKSFNSAVYAVMVTGNNSGTSNNCAAAYNTAKTGFAAALCTQQSFFWFAVGS
ncbi:hypothetical protein [Paludibacterium sp.]|uniref:beta strand repeat-containing protein n=1 Tax=Paludibacterium sp. TaxID=1917523 RepID=UPI0025E2D27B|nr:hypothetical protein [Paludibacterium sp.]MBV8649615.1 hypothetical protein [Paludibacterium sp.]